MCVKGGSALKLKFHRASGTSEAVQKCQTTPCLFSPGSESVQINLNHTFLWLVKIFISIRSYQRKVDNWRVIGLKKQSRDGKSSSFSSTITTLSLWALPSKSLCTVLIKIWKDRICPNIHPSIHRLHLFVCVGLPEWLVSVCSCRWVRGREWPGKSPVRRRATQDRQPHTHTEEQIRLLN